MLLTFAHPQARGAADFELESRQVGHGTVSLERAGGSLIVEVLLDHAARLPMVARGEVLEERQGVVHDGTDRGFAAAA